VSDDAGDPVEIPIEDVLDLHAFRPNEIPSLVDAYLTAACEAGFRLVRLVHGRGTGTQRAIVHAVLARHPLVVSHWDAPDSHLGATNARLREMPAERDS
jgi:dsDNA-specific endonuclease/ATPase MutS2